MKIRLLATFDAYRASELPSFHSKTKIQVIFDRARFCDNSCRVVLIGIFSSYPEIFIEIFNNVFIAAKFVVRIFFFQTMNVIVLNY